MTKEWGYYNNDNYSALEERYLETKDKKVLEEMYNFLLNYYKFKLGAYIKEHPTVYFEKETSEELIHRMACRSVMHYIYHPRIKGEFKMGTLSAYACYDFKKILFDEKEIIQSQNETSFDEIIESYDNNEPLLGDFDTSEFSKIDLLIDAERNLSKRDYKIFSFILNSQKSTIDDLVEEFELNKKQINIHLNNIRRWYANLQDM